MSPLGHHARSHRCRKPDRPFPPGIRVPHRLTVTTATTRAGSQDFVFFASAQTAVLRCKTRRHWLYAWRSDAASDVAAASRGFSRPHRFAQSQCNSACASLSQSAYVKRRSIVRLAARRQGRANDGLHLDRARSASGLASKISRWRVFRPTALRILSESASHGVFCNFWPWLSALSQATTDSKPASKVVRRCEQA